MWELDPAPFVFGEGGVILLQYPQAFPPMLPVEMVIESVTSTV